ncbi:MAG: hypothetical protein M3512_11610 [Bacteroidota bacterium]|nr:hypothetical protein [Bacteroidota bacterium]
MAQEISPKGNFLTDSIMVGERVLYTLAVKYPRNIQLIFPDSTYNFYPFEFIGKKLAPTKSDNAFSYDSVSYELSSFELEKVQTLSLPVFILSSGDSVEVFAKADTVFLVEMIHSEPDTLSVKEYITHWEVTSDFNYAIFWAAVIGVAVVFLGTFLLFGKIIIEKIKLYKLKKAHARFKYMYSKQLESFKNNKQQNPEELLIVWKKYMEELENMPYTKQTSKEIVINTENEGLKTSLKSIDRSIYGNLLDQDLFHSLKFLSEYSENRYNKKVQEVTHG